MVAVVADTNVYVSAFAFGGLPEVFLREAEAGGFQLVISGAILVEIAKVLVGAKFCWSEERVEAALQELSRFATHVEPRKELHVITADPSDNRILECAAEGGADYIVSGDKHLLRLQRFEGVPVVKVAKFLELMVAR